MSFLTFQKVKILGDPRYRNLEDSPTYEETCVVSKSFPFDYQVIRET